MTWLIQKLKISSGNTYNTYARLLTGFNGGVMKTTIAELEAFIPCEDRLQKLLNDLNINKAHDNYKIKFIDILKINGLFDAVWSLRTQKYFDYCILLHKVVSWVSQFAYDKRIHEATDAINKYLFGEYSTLHLDVKGNELAKYALSKSKDDSLFNAHHRSKVKALDCAVNALLSSVSAASSGYFTMQCFKSAVNSYVFHCRHTHTRSNEKADRQVVIARLTEIFEDFLKR